MRIGRNAFVQGACTLSVKGETYFLKTSRARSTHAHVHYICAQDRLIPLRISLSQSRDSCSRQKVVRLFKKWYDFSESPTTFPHISCSRRKERPSRARESLPPLAPWLRRIGKTQINLPFRSLIRTLSLRLESTSARQ